MLLLRKIVFGIIPFACFYNFAKSQTVVDPDSFTQNICGWYNASNYTTFVHIKTSRILSLDGVASYRYTTKNVFQIMQYYLYNTQDWSHPTVTGMAFYTRPWFNSSQNQLYSMDIEGGCLLNRKVQAWGANSLAKNRLFQIYPDGTIGSTCLDAEDWRLVLDDKNQQVMRKMSEVKPEDMKWKISNFKSVDYVPYA